ncbi:MAG: MerR family transcriptional regulator [Firmicutes bacterium]|nr:MerR family transcriptional regulator [Bacillota bacterium]
MTKYKIGEVAKLAGVSKRTVDYYTNLGLLRPVRSASNYRYYTDETLMRLKVIETMKIGRFTLEEIKEQLNAWDSFRLTAAGGVAEREKISVEGLRRQLKQLESQLAQLQSDGTTVVDAAKLRTKITVQSMALFQSLALYINEVSIYLK